MKKMMLIGIILALGCSSGPAPKDTVFEFIDAVKLDDSTRVVQILDLDSYIESMMMEMTPAESTQVIAENRLKIMQSLLGDGDVRQKWMHSLIVVNEEVVQDSLAEVEVSFIDQAAGHQLYTKMQLRRQPDKSWRIIYFR